MTMTKELTADRLRDLLDYDAETGIFTWRKTRGGKRAGSHAGIIRYRDQRIVGWDEDGEMILSEKVVQNIIIKIDGVLHSASILAFLYMTGRHPVGTIRRLSGDGTDNRWCNLQGRSVYDRWENKREAPSFL